MIYGIEIDGGGWWDLFCSPECAKKVHPTEPPEAFTRDEFISRTGTDVISTKEKCFECEKPL